VVDGTFEQESIVDGNIPDTIDFVPAWLASTSDRCVHHIVRDEEECLKLSTVSEHEKTSHPIISSPTQYTSQE
jgi:hypothetical protein